ncbi:MarR family winged helix-turn-helix transcriptional regulator [Planotetraspora thailandica]|nr:MarR family transcriptional regulator [Planotetraspora thailandica]
MPETRWLDEEEQQTWRAYIWTNHLLWEALERQLQRDWGIPHAYYIMLVCLSESPERMMSMTQLASVTQFSASRLSHAMSRLEEKGWVRRVKHDEDRRTTMAQLTDAGFEALEKAAPGHVEEVRRLLFDRLSRTQMRQLHDVLVTVLSALEAAEQQDGDQAATWLRNPSSSG